MTPSPHRLHCWMSLGLLVAWSTTAAIAQMEPIPPGVATGRSPGTVGSVAYRVSDDPLDVCCYCPVTFPPDAALECGDAMHLTSPGNLVSFDFTILTFTTATTATARVSFYANDPADTIIPSPGSLITSYSVPGLPTNMLWTQTVDLATAVPIPKDIWMAVAVDLDDPDDDPNTFDAAGPAFATTPPGTGSSTAGMFWAEPDLAATDLTGFGFPFSVVQMSATVRVQTFEAGRTVLAANVGSGEAGPHVSVLDPGSISLRTTLDLGADPNSPDPNGVLDIAITRDCNTAVVTSFPSQLITLVDLQTDPPTIAGSVLMPGAFSPEDVVCTPSGHALIADGGFDNRVLSVDIASQAVVSDLTLAVDAESVDVSPDGTLVLVTSLQSDVVRVLGLSPTGVLTDTGVSVQTSNDPNEFVDPDPLNVTISPNGRRALVAHDGSQQVGILDITGGVVTFLDGIDLLSGGSQSIAFNPAGDRAYVYHRSGRVSVLDIDGADNVTDSGIRIFGVGTPRRYFGVDQLLVTPDGLQVLAHAQGFVTVIDTASNTIQGTIGMPFNLGGGLAACTPDVGPPPCPCDLITTTPFLEPMGKRKRLGSVMPVKFRMYFDGTEITSEAQLEQILVDNGCEVDCPRILVSKECDLELGEGFPIDASSAGNANEGNCFRYSEPNWIFNLDLQRGIYERLARYRVEVKIGECSIPMENNLFDVK